MFSIFASNIVIPDEMLGDVEGLDMQKTLNDLMNSQPMDAETEKRIRAKNKAENERAHEIWERMREDVTPEELALFEMHFEVR